MLSMPPASMTRFAPAISMSWANMAAFIPEPHILLTVVQPAASLRPAPSEAWRAGAWPCPADSPAHHHLFDVRLGDARALNRGGDGNRSELMG